MDALHTVLQAIGAIVIGGATLSVIIYQAFKHLAARWLEAKFDERLQALKHEQQKELERLRLRISTLLDRATKLHQKEFEVLPEAWAKLNEAYWYVRSFVSALQAYPDLDRMGEAELMEFVDATPIESWRKAELKAAEDKTAYYQKAIFWHKLGEANSKSRDSYRYFVINGIFVSEDLRQDISIVQDLVWNALTEHRINEENQPIPRLRDAIGKLNGDGDERMKALERKIHSRLWPSTDTVS
jgi:hypothetical protein